LLKAPLLFFLGAVVAFLHKEEKSVEKLFLMGIAAPAILTSLITAAHAQDVDRKLSEAPPTVSRSYGPGSNTAQTLAASSWSSNQTPSGLSYLTFPVASYAQLSPCEDESSLGVFSFPSESTVEQLQRGFFGGTPTRVWFAIAGSRAICQEVGGWATANVNASALDRVGLSSQLYRPSGGFANYALVVGDPNLTFDQAQQVREKARAAGLTDTYLWRIQQ